MKFSINGSLRALLLCVLDNGDRLVDVLEHVAAIAFMADSLGIVEASGDRLQVANVFLGCLSPWYPAWNPLKLQIGDSLASRQLE